MQRKTRKNLLPDIPSKGRSGTHPAADSRSKIPDRPALAGWSNRLLLGDNLAALEALTRDPDVLGRVTLVYIDPPFATRREFRAGADRTATISCSREDHKAYEDFLTGPQYLEFLRRRLVLLRDLLADTGSLYLHIDYKVGHYVKVLMDEIFGAERFINDITRIKCNPKNFERQAYGNVKDMILFYSKSGRHVWNEAKEQMDEADIARLFPKVDAQGRRYATTPLHAPGETKDGATGKRWHGLLPPSGRHWRYRPEILDDLDGAGQIEWSSTGNPRKKIYADDAIRSGKKKQDVWSFKDPAYPRYPTEKNLAMLESIVRASSNRGDLVLDCFAGSGTTLIAAEKNGRRWIGIDSSLSAIRIIQSRIEELVPQARFMMVDTLQNPRP